MGCHFLLQRIFPTQGSKPACLHCRRILYHLSYQGRIGLSAKELMLSKCGAGEDSWESLECKEIKPVISKGIHPEYSLEGLMLKLQYFDHLMWRAKSLEKALMLGKIEGSDRGWDGWMASMTQWTWVWANSGRWWRTGRPGVLQSMGSQRVRHNLATEQQAQTET